jgi:glycosyltransferase involved in cell wall biosynthesis
MAEDYERRFGIRFQAFMNCVDVPDECPVESTDDTNQPIRLLYVGGLHLNRWRALADIGKALLVLRSEGRCVELAIHAPAADIGRYSRALSAIATIHLGESLTQDQIAPTMRAADVLIHVESFEPTVRAYTRLSLSTKVPQYMASGRPILAYGPKELASCAYIEDCQCGILVGEKNANLLLEAVRSLVADSQRRLLLGHRGWRIAVEQHRGDKVRQRFRSFLAQAAMPANGSPSTEPTSYPRG